MQPARLVAVTIELIAFWLVSKLVYKETQVKEHEQDSIT